MANGDQADGDVLSLRTDILRHALTAALAAWKGEGGHREDTLMAAAASFAQSRPLF